MKGTRIDTHQPAGQIFKQLRENERYSKTKVAQLLDVSKNHIGEIESGNCYPSFSLFIRMLALYEYELTIRRIPKFPANAKKKEEAPVVTASAPQSENSEEVLPATPKSE